MAKRILLIDQSWTDASRLTEMLTREGHTVIAANRCADAPVSERSRPDLILLDVDPAAANEGGPQLPDLGPCREGKATPLVLLSTLDEETLGHLAASCGADGYSRKHEDPAIFLESLRPYLDGDEEPPSSWEKRSA